MTNTPAPTQTSPTPQKFRRFFAGFIGWFVVSSVLFILYAVILGALGQWPLGGASWQTDDVTRMFLTCTALNALLTVAVVYFLRAAGEPMVAGVVAAVVLNQGVWLLTTGWTVVTLGVPAWAFVLLFS